MTRTDLSGVRLAELLGTVSLAVDLGLGQPAGHVARACLAADRLAQRAGVDTETRSSLFYVTLLGWVGCIADSREAAASFGDDIDYRAGVYDIDMKPLPFLGYLLRRSGETGTLPQRVRRQATLVATGARTVQDSIRSHCHVTANIAGRLGLGPEVCDPLGQVFARWDGKGLPAGLGGRDIAVQIRLWHVADVAEVHFCRGGVDAAVEVVRSRRGSQFDPEVADLFCAHANEILDALPVDTAWDDVVAADPMLRPRLTEADFDNALEVIADWCDLKSPWFGGHSCGVATLAAAAAQRVGLAPADVVEVRRAALLHDLGRVGVPNTIWDKTEPLTRAEAERVRLHSYYTERVLAQPDVLAGLGAIAGRAHERLDGSGYHRGLTAPSIPMSARIIAAADTYHTKREARPHRPALGPEEAAAAVQAEADAGRLDPGAVDAVLTAAGTRAPRRTTGPAGLTPRETQVLVLLARGASTRQVARTLGISPKTAGNHIERIYAKAGVSTRAAATLFAMQHGLLSSLEPLH